MPDQIYRRVGWSAHASGRFDLSSMSVLPIAEPSSSFRCNFGEIRPSAIKWRAASRMLSVNPSMTLGHASWLGAKQSLIERFNSLIRALLFPDKTFREIGLRLAENGGALRLRQPE